MIDTVEKGHAVVIGWFHCNGYPVNVAVGDNEGHRGC